ncbi:hypothetical protein J22TS1_33340 [Siminovitchia terrae]|nr:hypothetical protein J22TS1_33340 [Siminovitchia terrae]
MKVELIEEKLRNLTSIFENILSRKYGKEIRLHGKRYNKKRINPKKPVLFKKHSNCPNLKSS